MAESKKELKSLLMRVKEDSEKAGLTLSIQKTKIMASNPITSWQIDRKTMETVTKFIFMGSKITAYDDCSHEIKRCLLLGRKAMASLDSILKSKGIILLKWSVESKLCFIQCSCTDVRVGPWSRLIAEELMLSNCGAGEDSWEWLGQQGDQTHPSSWKSILNIYWKDWS